ncbi:MAG TPA: gamma-glutamyltransferase, partial [Solirubrobacteraceae bacterium]
MSAGGIVAAGHPRSAEAGAQVLRDGGNAVDAAVSAMLTACVCEPLLTGLGAGGYLLCAGFEDEPVLLDFFVAAPGEGSDGAVRADPIPVDVNFGGVIQRFNCGPATVGAWGTPAGICAATERWGSVALGDLVAGPAQLARDGVEVNAQQGYIWEILEGILTITPECEALFAPGGRS